MIKGAVIFALGAGSGLVVGGLIGLIEGFNLAKTVEQIAVDRVTTNKVA